MPEINALSQTLDTLLTVDFPRLIVLFGVLLIITILVIVIVFWRISNNSTRMDSQQWTLFSQTMINLNDYLKAEQGVNRAQLAAIAEEIRTNAQIRVTNYAAQTAATEGMAERLGELFTILDTQLTTMKQRLAEDKATNGTQWQKVNELGQGLKKDMGEVKDGNEAILVELREISREMKRLTDLVESAMNNLTATVDKISRFNELTNTAAERVNRDEPPPVKSQGKESTE